jgi:hypothetical protein
MTGLYPMSLDEVNHNAHLMTNKLECNHMLDKIDQMKKQLLHYDKLGKRWKKAKTATRYTCHTTGIILEVGGIAATFYTAVTIPLVIAGIGILDNLCVELIAKLFDIKVKKYQQKCKIIQKYIDELYLFIKKANADNVITKEEITEYQHILKEYDTSLNKVSEDHHKEVKEVVASAPELQKKIMECLQLMELTYGARKTGT